ncbi:MAG: lactonase family protein [Thermoleophilaceae bacterium]
MRKLYSGQGVFALLAALFAAAIGGAPGAAAAAPVGSLTQLPGPNSCLRDPVSNYWCPQNVNGLNGAMVAVISPDDRNVYVSSYIGSTIAEFSRRADGSLAPLPGSSSCIKDVKSPAGTNCPTTTTGLLSVIGMTMSSDGKFVYTGSGEAIDTFARDPVTGALSRITDPAGCIRNASTAVTNCDTTANIQYGRWITLSPDGQNAYVAQSAAHAIAEFSRDQLTGVLTQLPSPDGCIEDVNDNDSSVPLTDGTNKSDCTVTANGLDYPRQVLVAPDGLNAYVTSDFGRAISEFSRDASTGALHPLPGADNCIEDAYHAPSYTHCDETLPGLDWVYALAASPDGKNVYAGAEGGVITAFSRDPANGALRVLPGDDGCIKEWNASSLVACPIGNGLGGTSSLAISPDGRSLYGGGFAGRAISEFARDPSTGALTQLSGADACIEDNQAGLDATHCETSGQGIAMPRYMAVSPDGQNLYSPTSVGDDIAEFSRAVTTTGAALQSRAGASVAPAAASLAPASPPASGSAGAPPAGSAASAALTRLSLAPRAIVPDGRDATTAGRRKTGAAIAYRDSRPATTTFAVQRPTTGVLKGRRCASASARAVRRAKKRCTRYVVVGSFVHRDRAGVNRLHFSGRLRGRELAPGRYSLVAVPRLAGRAGATVTTRFSIVR